MCLAKLACKMSNMYLVLGACVGRFLLRRRLDVSEKWWWESATLREVSYARSSWRRCSSCVVVLCQLDFFFFWVMLVLWL